MFERFTDQARAVVVGAQTEAAALGHRWIGTEHLLVAALSEQDDPVTRALASLGLDAGRVRDQVLRELGAGVEDEVALRDLGIDLDAVRRRIEDRFGPGVLDDAGDRPEPRWWRRRSRRRRSGGGHIPFTPRAKKALELSLREALAGHSREIRVSHLVLGLMRTQGLAARVVTVLGVPPEAVRRAVLDLDRAA